MKAEKIVLSFIAILFGLFVAGIAFYIYESTRVVPKEAVKPIVVLTPSPTPTPSPVPIPLTVTDPRDESVVSTKIVTVNGKTNPDITLIISTGVSDQVITPSKTGDFSTTVTLEDGENKLLVTAIAPNGIEVTKPIIVTYSTESF